MIFHTKVDKLIIKNTKKNYQSYVYIAPEEMKEVVGLGQLFVIVEIRSKEKKVPEMLNQIVEEISEYYYHSPTKNVEAALETTCQYFNENILDITGKKIDWVRDKVHILIAAIQEDKLVLSAYQNIKVWMLRGGKIHDIVGQQAKAKKISSKKFLSQLISGQLENEDVLLLTNSTIFDYFSDEKIKKTISTLAPTQACAFFKNTLLDYSMPVDFSTIIVKFLAVKKEDQEIDPARQSDVLDGEAKNNVLQKRESGKLAKAAKTMGKKAWQTSVATVKYVKGKVNKWQEGTSAPQSDKTKRQEPALMTEGQTSNIKEEAGVNVLDNKARLGSLEKESLGQKIINRIKIPQYRLIILVLILVVLFASSLLIVNSNKETKKEGENFKTSIESMQERLNSIEAALIYKDENRAQEILKEVESIFMSLIAKNEEEEYKKQEIKDQLDDFVNKVYKLDKISDQDEVLVATLPSEVSPTANIFRYNKDYYFAQGKDIYKVNQEDKAIAKIATAGHEVVKIFSFEKNKAVLYGGGSQVSLIDLNNNTIQKVAVDSLEEDKIIVNVASYAQRLYVLSGNEIYKYTYSNTSFIKPVKWLEEGAELEGNNTMAIDGSIWLAARQGEITKLFRGKKEVFSLKGIYEEISENTMIYTEDGFNNIYLIDKEKNRIIIASKDGRVLHQLLGDDIAEIKSVLPSEDEKELFILTDEKLFKIGL